MPEWVFSRRPLALVNLSLFAIKRQRFWLLDLVDVVRAGGGYVSRISLLRMLNIQCQYAPSRQRLEGWQWLCTTQKSKQLWNVIAINAVYPRASARLRSIVKEETAKACRLAA